MLSKIEIATIRAALRYWLDEIVPHDASVARPYFDGPVTTPLDQASVADLIDRFETTRLRYVIADLDTERITTDRLLTADEVAE